MICHKATNVITLTEEDKKNLIKIGANKYNIEMLPAIIVDTINQPAYNFCERENSIMYVGSLSWDANIDNTETLASIISNK